jgi:hypothetical protein
MAGDAGRRIHKVDLSVEAVADGTYDTDTADLINELQTQLNDLITKLQASGLMEK